MFMRIYRWFTGPIEAGAPPRPITTRETMILFGAKLRLARSKAGLSQKELAALLPTTKVQEVHEWEFAKSVPRPTQRDALYDLLGEDLK